MFGYLLKEGCVLLWDSGDISRLRSSHRVLGSLIGSLLTRPKQNKELGMPLMLMPEETTLLIEQGVLVLRVFTSHSHTPSVADQDDLRTMCCQLLQKDEITTEGPDVQATVSFLPTASVLSPEQCLHLTKDEEQLETNCSTGHPSCIPLPTTTSGTSANEFKGNTTAQLKGDNKAEIKWEWPRTPSQVLRYQVFKDLWQKGFYITSGLKFGGEYLVYEHDPLTVHSTFVTKIVSWNDMMSSTDLVVAGRLGGKVNKRTLLCSVSPEDHSVHYLTLYWSGLRCQNT